MNNKIIQYSVNFLPWQFRGWIKHIPIISNLQRWFFAKFLAGQEFIHLINAGPAKGLKYPVQLPEDKAIWSGTYEPDFALVLANSVQPGDICYDIGGYRGFFSSVFALAGAKLVITFEPLPANVSQLRRLAEVNPQLPLRLESIAVGEEDGFVEFYVMPEASMGKLENSSFQAEVKGTDLLTVPIRKLDSLVSEETIPAPQVIKIDVEGAEVQVLKGAREMLCKYHPLLLIEAHSPLLANDCTCILRELGYQVSVLETGFAPNPQSDPEVCHLIAKFP